MFRIVAITMCAIAAFATPSIEIGTVNADSEIICQVDGLKILNVREISNILCGKSFKEEVEVTFQGKVSPPDTYFYTKTKNRIVYSGMLKLQYFRYKDGNTYATYTGTMSAEY